MREKDSYKSWKEIISDLKEGYLNDEEAWNHLEELSYELSEDELEEAESALELAVREVNPFDSDDGINWFEDGTIPDKHPEDDDDFYGSNYDAAWDYGENS